MTEVNPNRNPDLTKSALLILFGIVIFAGVLYASYRYSMTKNSDVILPGGVTYLGPSPTAGETKPTAFP